MSKTVTLNIPAPVGGINALNSIMQMPPSDALLLENFIPYPDRISTRPGRKAWLTGLPNPGRRLATYAAVGGAESLWLFTDAGIYNATAGGAIGSTVMALTNGKVVTVLFGTGAGNYLFSVNGSDTLKQYDGTTWTSIATLGATNTATYSYVDSYRQRVFFVVRNSLNMEYLAPNAISGAPTSYAFGSVFKLGGKIIATNSWTIDGGAGPDDYFVVCTSKGELAVFSGNDPATWALKGVFYIGRPLGQTPLFKYGGDLLFNCEAGLFPVSSALQSSSIDRTRGISAKIKQLFADAGSAYFANDGWQIIAMPDIPLLVVNIPAEVPFQYVMHAETGSWARFTGWVGNGFARMGNILYYCGNTTVFAVGGANDDGANIACVALGAYSNMGYPKKKQIKLIKPYFLANGIFNYAMGVGQNFNLYGLEQVSTFQPNNGRGRGIPFDLWNGANPWGTAIWGGSSLTSAEWRTVPDQYSDWKAFYLQITTNTVSVSYLGADLRVMTGSDF